MSTDDTRSGIPAPLSAVAIRSYLRATGWTEGTHGSRGSVFERDGFKVSVPLEDRDPDLIRMALYRLAVAEKREPGETEAAVWAHRDASGEGLSVPADEWAAFRAAEIDAAVPVPDDSGQDLPSAPEPSRDRTGPSSPADRETLGRLVHDTRLASEAERAEAEGRHRFLLPPWGERTEYQRELDMRIGDAVARAATAELEAKLAAIEALCPGRRLAVVADILAIIGTGEEPS